MVRLIAVLALLPAVLLGYTTTTENGVTVYLTDGSRSDVQSAVTAASDGEVVDIPEGSFTWTSGLSFTKGIHIRGQGGGGFLGRSETFRTIETGLKTFTLDSNAYSYQSPEVGDEVTIWFCPDGANYNMTGTVTSYSAPTLEVDVTSTTGTASEDFWVITKAPKTQINRNYDPGAGNPFWTVNSSATDHARVSGIGFAPTSGGGIYLLIGGSKPAVVTDCWFRLQTSGGQCVETRVNRGVVSGCSFSPSIIDRDYGASNQQGVQVIGPNSSWTTVSSMGMDDTNGDLNLYIEDCYFFGQRETALDNEDNGRVVWRYNVMDHSSVGGHGQDTGNHGARHCEIYGNKFIYKDDGSGKAFAISNDWVHPRGGTGVTYNNLFENKASQSWGSNKTYKFQIQNLQRAGGPNGCWSAGDGETVYPASGWPCPRQIGFGYVTGEGDYIASGYRGDFEPWYVWGNTGDETTPATHNYGGSDCTNPDMISAYIFVDTNQNGIAEGEIVYGDAKPGWTEYTYPHPAIAGSQSAGATYGGRLRFNGTGSKPVRTDGVGQPIIFDQ